MLVKSFDIILAALTYIASGINEDELLRVVFEAEIGGISLHAAILAVDQNLGTILKNQAAVPTAKWLLDIMLATRAAA